MAREQTIQITGKKFNLKVHYATVLQYKKFSRMMFFTRARFFPQRRNVLFTDVVFRLTETNKEQHLYTHDVELPIYEGQAVDIIMLNEKIIAFIDFKTREYYYTTDDFCSYLHLGMRYFLLWVIGIAGAIIHYLVFKGGYLAWMIMPFILALIAYMLINAIINRKVEKTLDDFLQNEY